MIYSPIPPIPTYSLQAMTYPPTYRRARYLLSTMITYLHASTMAYYLQAMTYSYAVTTT